MSLFLRVGRSWIEEIRWGDSAWVITNRAINRDECSRDDDLVNHAVGFDRQSVSISTLRSENARDAKENTETFYFASCADTWVKNPSK